MTDMVSRSSPGRNEHDVVIEANLEKRGCEVLIDAEQAAEILNCSSKTVKRMAARGELPALQIGNRWRFRASLLDDWVRSQVISAGHPCPEKGQA